MNYTEAIHNLKGEFKYTLHYKCRQCGAVFNKATNGWGEYYHNPYYVLYGEYSAPSESFHQCTSDMIGVADIQGATKLSVLEQIKGT